MNKRLEKIFCQAFGLCEINDDMSIANVKGWDSMAHVGLIMALQKEFGVSISPADAIDLTDIRSIRKFLESHEVKYTDPS